MAVTELAILPLKPGVSLANPSFRAKLLQSINVMENALDVAGRRFVYYQGIEDADVLYLLGDWQSPSEHWDQFIPSPENQQLLELLKDDFDIPRIQMYHVDVPNTSVPADTQVICIGWYRVRTEDKTMFEEQAANWSKGNPSRVHKSAGGWRIEKPDDRDSEEEWVRFSGWDNAEDHIESCQTKAARQDSHSKGLLLGSTIKHGVRINL